MHKIWPGRRAHKVKYENISNSDVVGMSLASFCQSRAYETATPSYRKTLGTKIYEGNVILVMKINLEL